MAKEQEKEQAPPFSLVEYGTGRQVSLDDFQGCFVMLTFWVSWCPDCHRDLPKKEKLFKAMKDNRDFVLLTINVTGREGDPDDGIRFTEDHGLPFPVLRDQETTTYDAYDCSSVPFTVLLNRDHKIEARFDDHDSFVEVALALEHMMTPNEKNQES